jgi:hypothetical protein
MRPTTHRRSVALAAAAALAALALAAPPAVARPILDPPTQRDLSAPPPVQAADESFDWGSAGIGAAATGGLVLVAAGGFAAAQRARVRPAR